MSLNEYLNPWELIRSTFPAALTLVSGVGIGYLSGRYRSKGSIKFILYTLPVILMTVVSQVTAMPTIFVVLYAMLGHYFGDGLIAIGLTGGISTGKSTVSAVFKKLNAVIIDADLIARQVVEPGKPAYNRIVAMFGNEVLNPDKTINRPMLGSIIFNNPAKRQALNACTHRYIILEMFSQLLYQRLILQRRLVIFDAPLLFETKLLQYFCGPIIVVACSEGAELERLMARDKLTEEKAKARIKSQMSLQEKVKMADVVIDNNGTKEALEVNAEATLRQVARSLDASGEVKRVVFPGEQK
ncbi:unnamed protein product [Aphanomyces euteiches]|uniref:Dephospho-CoA kinase n=1 Tax=Aphanomyces euteiches TaxID=100861 RepID=A0A6G0XV69_9STRA|nr:hypothetical protein Ae201684_000915 [Aphanomyces euteiches]KAH9099547.1 hypothetical protein Ae201684P_018560 [Aphanomyces euteiches]KAH9141530.1 hypothetical protein AeRB84_014310 [Aphanomyces euteiches]